MILYWIHTQEMVDPFVEGYVGVTSRSLRKRISDHKSSKQNYKLSEAFSKEDCTVDVLEVFETIEDALAKEKLYRPLPNIGWNIAQGGGLLPNATGWWTEEHSKATSERLRGNTHKLNKLDSEETKLLKSKRYHEDYEFRSKAVKNKDVNWTKNISKNRRGKGLGDRNGMSSKENRDKVARSKIGRKRIYREDGTFYMSPKIEE